jgi:hypothetical protein
VKKYLKNRIRNSPTIAFSMKHTLVTVEKNIYIQFILRILMYLQLYEITLRKLEYNANNI